jgi:hypothetical protein
VTFQETPLTIKEQIYFSPEVTLSYFWEIGYTLVVLGIMTRPTIACFVIFQQNSAHNLGRLSSKMNRARMYR